MIRLFAALIFGALLALAAAELYHAHQEPAFCPVPTQSRSESAP